MKPSDLETLVPQPRRVEVAGEVLEITPLVIGELPPVLKAVRPIAETVAEQFKGAPDWLALFCEHGEALLTVLALASRRSPEWVAKLAMDEAITLAVAVFEVNADFFVQRIAPQLGRLADTLGKRSAGVMPSPA